MDPLEEALDWALMGNHEDFDSLEEFGELDSSPESIINTCNIQPLGDFPPLDVEEARACSTSGSGNSSSDSFGPDSDDPFFLADSEIESEDKTTDESQVGNRDAYQTFAKSLISHPEAISAFCNSFQDSKVRPVFPALRIRSIMKMDPTLNTISREVSVLMSFAAEIFIRDVAKVSWAKTETRKCTIMNRADVAAAIEPIPRFNFLADIVPYWDGETGIKDENDGSNEDNKQDLSSDENPLFDYDQEHNDQKSEFFEQVSSFESKDVA